MSAPSAHPIKYIHVCARMYTYVLVWRSVALLGFIRIICISALQMSSMVDLLEKLADPDNDDEADDDIAAMESKMSKAMLDLVEDHDVDLRRSFASSLVEELKKPFTE